jgi:hypothetical protein
MKINSYSDQPGDLFFLWVHRTIFYEPFTGTFFASCSSVALHVYAANLIPSHGGALPFAKAVQ